MDQHISLLKKLQTLTAQPQAKAGASAKNPRASQAPPTLPGSLASSLEKWRDSFDWGSGAPTATLWQGISNAAQATAARGEALSLARYYVQPDTVALLRANPTAVPDPLRGPVGMTRQQACEQFGKLELPAEVGCTAADHAV